MKYLMITWLGGEAVVFHPMTKKQVMHEIIYELDDELDVDIYEIGKKRTVKQFRRI